MPDGPTLLQRQAIGNMFKTITDAHPNSWGNWLFETLEDWGLLPNSDISISQYYDTLVNLPAFPKRIICQIITMGWNEHHDLQAFYDAITTLIYLKVCGPSEYFFLHQVYNFIKHFRRLSGKDKNIFIQRHNVNKYTIRFTSDGHVMGEALALVELEMSKTSEAPMVVVSPWFMSFDNLADNPEGTAQSQPTQKFIEDEILPIICNEFAKRHSRRIFSNYEMRFRLHPYAEAPMVFLTNLQYIG